MKKKISFLLMIITVLVVCTGCITINLGDKSEKETSKVESKNDNIEKEKSDIKLEDNKEEKEQEKVDNKNNQITIVIDPGHSSTGTPGNEPVSPNSSITKLKDGLGATGKYSNIEEHKTNMSVALLLKKELESKGYNVVLTKESVEQSKSNIERAQVGNKNNADLVVRIHADACEDSSVKGASIHVPANNNFTSNFYEISKSYGSKIINTYAQEVNMKNRGVIERNDLTGFNWSKVPVVLVEMGFLSNKEDDMFVSNDENHPKIAKAIANGIYKCFE